MPPIIVVTGFAPFGGERINPSWEVARNLDGDVIGGLQVKSVRLPVNCLARGAPRRPPRSCAIGRARFSGWVRRAAGRRCRWKESRSIFFEQSKRRTRSMRATAGDPVIRDAPDAYFSRLPMGAILRALQRRKVPVVDVAERGRIRMQRRDVCRAARDCAAARTSRSDSSTCPSMRRNRRAIPRCRACRSTLMEHAIRAAIAVIAREALAHSANALHEPRGSSEFFRV